MTSGWTETHTALLLALASVAGGSVAAMHEGALVGVLVATALVAAATISLAFEPLAGIVVGLAAAAAVTFVKRVTGVWVPPSFLAALIESVAFLATGVSAGLCGTLLRKHAAAPAERPEPLGSPVPAFGSLGLLDGALGAIRLEEEVERASMFDRPLSVAVFYASAREPLPERARRAGLRVLARTVESRLGIADVPFALGEDEIAIILPEADGIGVRDRIAPIANAIYGGSFRDRDASTERRFADVFELGIGYAVRGEHNSVAEDLLLTATTAAKEVVRHGESDAQEGLVEEAGAGAVRYAPGRALPLAELAESRA